MKRREEGIHNIIRDTFPFIEELTLIPVLNEFTYLSTKNINDKTDILMKTQVALLKEKNLSDYSKCKISVFSYSFVPGFKTHWLGTKFRPVK